MEDKTRLELAHKRWHKTVATLVSPPYTGAPDELEAIRPLVDKAAEEFCTELLKDKDEAIEFLSKNRLEVENFFGDLYLKFNTPDVYSCLFNYYARNFPSRKKEQIEEILERKCAIVKQKNK